MRFTLLTGRSIYQGSGRERGKFSPDYWKSVSICEMDPEDMKLLKVRDNELVKVSTSFGSVIVRAVSSMEAPHRGIIFIPYGPLANLVVDPRTDGTGMPSFKGLKADVEPAPKEALLSLEELIKKYYGRG